MARWYLSDSLHTKIQSVAALIERVKEGVRRKADSPQILRKFGIFSFVCSFLVIYCTYKDYGVTWDDWINAVYGKLVYQYFASGFQDRSCNDFFNMKNYGPLIDLLASLTFPDSARFPDFELRHLISACFGLATVLGVLHFCKLLEHRIIAPFSALALVSMPQFYGYAFINAKDIPLACAFTWLQVAILTAVRSGRITWPKTLLTGLCYGIVFSIRPGIMPLTIVMAVLLLTYLWLARQSAQYKADQNKILHNIVPRIVAIGLISWGVMVSFWPWAHLHPLINPLTAIYEALKFQYSYPVLFAGEYINSDALPWYYLPQTLMITIPVPTLILFGIGLTVISYRVAHFRSNSASSGQLFLLLQWITLPVISAMVARPNIYDGIRHFLFIVPAIAIIAGYGASVTVSLLNLRIPRAVAVTICAALLSFSLIQIVKLHPYQYCYYNVFVGGLGGAYSKYETDYWVTSYKEAALWLNRIIPPDRTAHVLVAANELSFAAFDYYAHPNIITTQSLKRSPEQLSTAEFDYYVSTTRYKLDAEYAGAPIVKTVGRDGAIFTVIKKLPRL